MASLGACRLGSGTSATRTRPGPSNTTARIYRSSGNVVSTSPVSRTSSFAART